MRVRHIMNKHGRSAGSGEVAKPADQAWMDEVQEVSAPLASAAEVEAPAEASSRPEVEAPEVILMYPPTGADLPVKQESIVPEFPSARASKEDLIRDSFATLLHHPDKWYPLNKLFSRRRDVLFGVEDVVKDQGVPNVRTEFEKLKGALNADLIWSLHQPLLALIVFILKEENDIHRKLVRVPDLKTDICRTMGLGQPSEVKPAASSKPKSERTVKKPQEDASGEQKLNAMTKIQTETKHGLKRSLGEELHATPPGASRAPSLVAKGSDGFKRKSDSAEIYLSPAMKLKPGYSIPVKKPDSTQPGTRLEPPPAKKLKTSNVSGKELEPGKNPVKKLKSVEKKQGTPTLHQLIASSQERDRSGKFAPGFSPGKLKKVVNKSGMVSKGVGQSGGGGVKDAVRNAVTKGGEPGNSQVAIKGANDGVNAGPRKGVDETVRKASEKGVNEGVSKAVSLVQHLTLETPKVSSRKQLTPRRATPNGVSYNPMALTPRDEFPATPPREKAREDTAIAALVCALRSREEQDAQAIDKMAMPEVVERIGKLEATRRREEAELEQLLARRQALLGAEASERDGGGEVSAAREKCLRAIGDLLDVLPADLGKVPLEVFNELERTDDFEGTLGALARTQREHWQREWNRKDQMAAEAKRAHLEALYQKNKVRRHLGIEASDPTGEQSTEFGTFQEKLAELRQELERQVALLIDTEKGASQAWHAYRATA